MAERTPGGFTQYIDIDAVVPRGQVVSSEPDQTLDDQVYCLDRGDMIASVMWNPVYTINDEGAETLVRMYVRSIQMCGSAYAGQEAQWCVRAWASDAGTAALLYLFDATTAITSTIVMPAGTVVPTWLGWGTNVGFVNNDGTYDEIQVQARRAGAQTGKVFVAGIGLFFPGR